MDNEIIVATYFLHLIENPTFDEGLKVIFIEPDFLYEQCEHPMFNYRFANIKILLDWVVKNGQ